MAAYLLRFIDARFKPAVLITDDAIEGYYREHQTALARKHPARLLYKICKKTFVIFSPGKR